MSKVSVALATYNGERYILKQLQSLLSQRRMIDEVIICDDASSDQTVDIVRNFIQDNRLLNWKLHVNSENIGFVKNFKKAIEITSGDIIFLCDQDDIWYKTKIGSMLNRFESDERIKAIYSGFKFINENDSIIRTRQKLNHANNNLIKFHIPLFETVKIDLSTICSYNISPGCTLGFTKQVKDIYLSKTKSHCVHDWEIASIAAFLNGLYFFNTPLISYRIHNENTIGLSEITNFSAKKQLAKYDIRLKKAKKINNYFDSMQAYYYLLSEHDLNIVKEKANFAKMRLEALSEKNMSKILSLYKYNKHYLKSVTLKGRIADLLCIIKK